MNKKEIMDVLSEKSSNGICAYCKEEIRRGYYAEDDIGKRFIFPMSLTRGLTDKEVEIPVHYKCIDAFIFDLLREGGGDIDGTPKNTRILIRY